MLVRTKTFCIDISKIVSFVKKGNIGLLLIFPSSAKHTIWYDTEDERNKDFDLLVEKMEGKYQFYSGI